MRVGLYKIVNVELGFRIWVDGRLSIGWYCKYDDISSGE